jgi:hypothetical protein
VQGNSWLGVALVALMHIPAERAAWLGTDALRRIKAAPLTDQQRFLLGKCVKAYLELDPPQQRELERLLTMESYRRVQAINTTWHDKGLQQGLEKGREGERRAMLRDLLEDKYGALSDQVQQRLQQCTADQLLQLKKSLIRAQSLRELGLED